MEYYSDDKPNFQNFYWSINENKEKPEKLK
jgi:hypothetical protein